MTGLERRGWHRFPATPGSLQWARAAREVAMDITQDPDQRAQWLRCGATWFVGVDALPTAPDGSIGGVPLPVAFLEAVQPMPSLHPAQLSVVYPGYPRPMAGESDAAFRYRRIRDAAHVDGILAEGAQRRRFIREPHAFVLGIALTKADPGASPLVVWEGSHVVIREALERELSCHSREMWQEIDVTDAYQAARRRCFESCRRVEMPALPGEAILLHRLALHGVAPWADGATAAAEGRMVAYFRPLLAGGIAAWLG
ncbi:hypothetical protein KUH32_16750 [Thalassococcus sp. CAU 1522]|uniref:Phytanoyl-CoA dioxygenase n=1 Tax=Thalassococcus arenae TaxID=2851652 RepID=A0ABS6NBM0_9RHOB|nr:hypothetical protein [Thalassococcus arenae]MBV2361416.1 hypothetical protein [Thalassococcus arenae]